MMQNPRVFLWIGLALVLFMNYQAWLRDFSAPTSTTTSGAAAANTAASGGLSDTVPQVSAPGPILLPPPHLRRRLPMWPKPSRSQMLRRFTFEPTYWISTSARSAEPSCVRICWRIPRSRVGASPSGS